MRASERQELAIISHRGLIFLLCTRNSHRGWILNTGSGLARKGVAFDSDNKIVFFSTEREEKLLF